MVKRESPLRERGFMHYPGMGQTIDTSHITYVARLLRDSAPSMPEPRDTTLFLRAASALEDRASKLTYGTPASGDPHAPVDILV